MVILPHIILIITLLDIYIQLGDISLIKCYKVL